MNPIAPPGFELLSTALKIWEHKLSSKYRDRFDKFSRKIYEENQKHEDIRDLGVITDCEFELQLLERGFIAEVNRSAVGNPK